MSTRSRKTAKPRSVTAVTAVSLRCGVVEGDAAAAADDARNRSLRDRQESPWRGKMRSLLLLPTKAMRLKTLQGTRRASAPRSPRLLKIGRWKIGQRRIGQLRLGPPTAGQQTLGQSTPGLTKAGQPDLDPRVVTRVLAHNAGPSRADQIREDRIRGAPIPADPTRADRN